MKIRQISEGVLFEAGLSRLLSHTSDPFALLTAFRSNFSYKENLQRNAELERMLKRVSAGGIKVVGHWMEAPDDMPWHEAKRKGMLHDSAEESYFVPCPKGWDFEKFKGWVLTVIMEFNQDAAVISDGVSAMLLFKDGGTDVIGSGTPTVGKIAQAYSDLGGRPFVFEGTMRPSNNAHKMWLTRRGVGWV